MSLWLFYFNNIAVGFESENHFSNVFNRCQEVGGATNTSKANKKQKKSKNQNEFLLVDHQLAEKLILVFDFKLLIKTLLHSLK